MYVLTASYYNITKKEKIKDIFVPPHEGVVPKDL